MGCRSGGCSYPNGSLNVVCTSSQIIKLLLAAGGQVDDHDSMGMTPLSYTAQKDFHAVRTLIEHGAEINTCDIYGEKSLINAVIHSQDNTILFLLQKKQDTTKQVKLV